MLYHLLSPFDLWCSITLVLLIFSLDDLSRDESGVFKPPTVVPSILI